MRVETRKILDPKIEVTATCVRVPVFVGHAVSANVEFESEISVKEALKKLKSAPGIKVVDNPEEHLYATPIESVGEDDVFVSRLRKDKTVPHGLSLWIVADNVRKGAALNAIQIAEHLIKDYL